MHGVLNLTSTRKASTASNSTQSINAICAFSTVLGLPVRHFATIASHTSFAYLQQKSNQKQINWAAHPAVSNCANNPLIHLPASASAAFKKAMSASRAFSCTGALESATAFLKKGPDQKRQAKHYNNFQKSPRSFTFLHSPFPSIDQLDPIKQP